MNFLAIAITAVLAAALGAGACLLAVRTVSSRRRATAEEEARRIREDAERDAAARLHEIELQGQERIAATERAAHDELKSRRREIDQQRREHEQKLRNLNRRHELLESKEREIAARENEARQRSADAERLHQEARDLQALQQQKIEQIARMTAEQARHELVSQIRGEARKEAAAYLRKVQEETREEADREARGLVLQSLERFSSAQIVDPTITVVELPNEEMKGRIIGREGRNIRSLEMATGIDLLVDDTPQAILLSCFDPIRREIARISVERLVEDGRIHPARIEEVVEKTREEFEEHIVQGGETAAFELGIAEIHPRLIRLVGRMRYCHHLGHNLLQHTRETVLLAANIASQMKGDSEVVRRAAFLHEIGNVEDSSSELHPTLRSAELAQKFNESERVVEALRSLHPDAKDRPVEGVLVLIGHQIASARPGAQKDNLELFTKRMTELETIASGFPGVRGSFAIKAGKELRVMVDSAAVSDTEAIWLARDIARKIQDQVGFPGQIRVSVVRETRSVDYAM